MLQYPTLVLNDIPRLNVTDEVEDCLIALGDESIGPEGNYTTSGQYLYVKSLRSRSLQSHIEYWRNVFESIMSQPLRLHAQFPR